MPAGPKGQCFGTDLSVRTSPGGYFHQSDGQWAPLLPALKQQKLIKKALPPKSYYTNAYN